MTDTHCLSPTVAARYARCIAAVTLLVGCSSNLPPARVDPVTVSGPPPTTAVADAPSAPLSRRRASVGMAIVPGAKEIVRVDFRALLSASWFQSFRQEESKERGDVAEQLDALCGFSLLDALDEGAASVSTDDHPLIAVKLSRPHADLERCIRGMGFAASDKSLAGNPLFVKDDQVVVLVDSVLFVGGEQDLRRALEGPEPRSGAELGLREGETIRVAFRDTEDFELLDGSFHAADADLSVFVQATFKTDDDATGAVAFVGQLNGAIRAAAHGEGVDLPNEFALVRLKREGRAVVASVGGDDKRERAIMTSAMAGMLRILARKMH